MPKISVCIPTFNGERYLKETLSSVLAQTYKDFEVIVVDDHSNDSTCNIVNKFVAIDSRVFLYVNEKNQGLVGNWNRCVDIAKGEWIKFVFQDDLLHPDCIGKMMAHANKSNQFIVCQRDVIYNDYDKNSSNLAQTINELPYLKSIFPNGGYINPETIRKTSLEYPDKNYFGEPTATLLHRDLFSKYGKFNPLLAQLCDYEYWIRVASNEGLFIVPQILASFRVHNDSTTSKNNDNKLFIMEYLDRLAVRYEILFNQHFSGLRHQAKKSKPQINLRKEFYNLMIEAEWFAKEFSNSKMDLSYPLLKELEFFIYQHPNLYKTLFFWRRKTYKWLEKNVLWRLR
ncbi:glycosyltransferase [Methylomonas sp. MO1]|uniref:glycosyltransferase family 2 protein n=1 Tax=unclassified Methylomonas TaxID=2608980 RepID=UPI000479FDB1|nr:MULTISPECIES: glycosyltransferase [unclassified Methylomonas]MDT4292313.1 glycosyltransferase [Methylomonas sp. MO1]